MIYVESILFESAGLPLTAYQKYLSNMRNLQNNNNLPSVFTDLKTLGYTTLAAHTEFGINYNRIAGYLDLGFGAIMFENK